MFRGLRERIRGALDPQRYVYESQKLKLRRRGSSRGIERLTGARPGPGLQIELRGSRGARGRDPARGQANRARFRGGAALLAAVLAAAADSIDAWVPITLGVAAGVAASRARRSTWRDGARQSAPSLAPARAEPPLEHDREQRHQRADQGALDRAKEPAHPREPRLVDRMRFSWPERTTEGEAARRSGRRAVAGAGHEVELLERGRPVARRRRARVGRRGGGAGEADQGLLFCWTGTGHGDGARTRCAACAPRSPGSRGSPRAPAAGTTRTCS